MGGAVAVAADNHRSRQREALLGPDNVNDSLPRIIHREERNPKIRAIFCQRFYLKARFRIGNAPRAVFCRNIMIRHRQTQMRRTHAAPILMQAFKSLWACHLMHKMPVNRYEAGAIGARFYAMRVPDLVIESLRSGAWHKTILLWRASPACAGPVFLECAPRAPEARADNRAWRGAPVRGAPA